MLDTIDPLLEGTKKRSRKPKSTKKDSAPQKKRTSSIQTLTSSSAEIGNRTLEIPEGLEEQENVVFKPNPGPQTAFLAASEREVLYGGPLHDDTLVITDKGRVKISEIGVGNKVLTPKGTFTPVTDIPFIGVEESYCLTFSNGAKVIASAGHKWFVSTGDWAKTATPFRTKRTNELLDFELTTGKSKYRLPSVAPYVFKEQQHFISPYIMGVLLADGCITNALSVFTVDAEVVARLKEEVHPDYEFVFRQGIAYGLVKKSRSTNKPNAYKEELKRLGLYGHNAFTKSIPSEYLYDSIENRLSLLHGLMDSDGTCRSVQHGRRGAEAKYTTVSTGLRDTFISLAESLGYSTTWYSEILATGNTAYRISIRGGSFNPFYLSRKADNYAEFNQSNKAVMLVNVEPVGTQNVRCITVEDEDSLFVLDRNITTHNSAGGGKSYSLLADPLRYVSHPQFSGLILRHTTEELRELIWKSQELYPKIVPGIVWSERKMQWQHPNGGRLWMSYLDRDDDVLRYQGLSFTYVAFDELTQWSTPFAWNYMRSRLRTAAPDLPIFMRATTNPGNSGHWWVKKMFVDPAPIGTAFWATDIETGQTLTYPKGHEKEGQPLFKRRFISAKLWDNPYLASSGDYEAMLLSLPETQRRQLLYGDWDIAEGAAFPEFNRSIHVVEPYRIPADWTRFRACDYGYGSWSAVLWFAVAPDESLVVYRELYVTKVLAEDLAVMILNAEEGEKIRYGVLDSSTWAKRGDTGPSIAERMILKGCKWRPSDRSAGSRVAGKNEFHRRLQIDEFTGKPRMTIFNTCTNFIAQLPLIPLDKNNPDDIDVKYRSDHVYDAARYGIMSRPRSKSVFDFDDHHKQGYVPACQKFGY